MATQRHPDYDPTEQTTWDEYFTGDLLTVIEHGYADPHLTTLAKLLISRIGDDDKLREVVLSGVERHRMLTGVTTADAPVTTPAAPRTRRVKGGSAHTVDPATATGLPAGQYGMNTELIRGADGRNTIRPTWQSGSGTVDLNGNRYDRDDIVGSHVRITKSPEWYLNGVLVKIQSIRTDGFAVRFTEDPTGLHNTSYKLREFWANQQANASWSFKIPHDSIPTAFA
jgi:hypothetical protein